MLSNHKWLIFFVLVLGMAHVVAQMYNGYYDTTVLTTPSKVSVLQVAMFDYPWLTGSLYIVKWIMNAITACGIAVLAYEGLSLLRGVKI